MKRIFHYAATAMSIMAVAIFASCNPESNGTDSPNKPNEGSENNNGETVRLATPKLREVSSTNTSIVLEWDAVENAASYAYRVDEADEKSTDALTVEISSLAPGVEHVIEVRAVAPAGSQYRNSTWASYPFYREPEIVDPQESLQSWLGEYDVVSESTLQIEGYGNITKYTLLEGQQMEFTISIEPSYYEDMVRIYGMTSIDETWYAVAAHLTDENGNVLANELAPVLDYEITTSTEGYSVKWFAIGQLETAESPEIISGCEYPFYLTDNGDGTYEFTPLTGKTSTGVSFTVLATDMFADQGTSVGMFYDTWPVNLPAGKWTLTKK
ncbi:MAG TPA: hypothetical protein IAC04_07010 [Candidatus Coprenecus stercoravium]|uniref:Fibronectin type-III domain-containing protein n=1 Tax=Candidatus Coprenecus stercoravium TaxID=2840735 RepID=A0A9D2K9S4_9BACT|nr:hypothetical protein [Candidatus Coprenecus stercoravium]